MSNVKSFVIKIGVPFLSFYIFSPIVGKPHKSIAITYWYYAYNCKINITKTVNRKITFLKPVIKMSKHMQGKHISCLFIYIVKLEMLIGKIFLILKCLFTWFLVHDIFWPETMCIVFISLNSKNISILSLRKINYIVIIWLQVRF